ncbi:MAG: hypothetical protein ACAI25_13175 [Planctomycetota bacterium]
MSRLLSALALVLSLSLLLGLAQGEQPDEELLQGLVDVVRADDFDGKLAKILYRVDDQELRFAPGKEPKNLKAGNFIKVRGKANGNKFDTTDEAQVLVNTCGKLASCTCPPQAAGGTTSTSGGGTTVPAVTGDKHAIVIIVSFTDKANGSTPASLTNVLFNASNSVNAAYKELSYNQVSWSGTVVGPFTINYQSTGTDYYAWGNAADAAATAAGVNLSSYAYRIYAIPTNGTGYGGLGQMPGTKTWVFYENGKIYAHELGHNLGMHHASTPGAEYGDATCFMGNAGLTHTNSPHKVAMGWIPSGNVQTVTQNGTYMLARSEDQRAEAQLLKFSKPDTGESYYVSYRRPIGFDAGLSTSFTDRASVHSWNGNSTTQTFLLSALADTQSYTDTVNGITITQTSHNDTHSYVQVSFTPVPRAPTVTMSPASQSGAPGLAKTYTLTVKNNDGNGSPSATFTLTPTVPAGFSGTLTATTLTLGPGAQGTSTFTLTPSASTTGGTYTASVAASDPLVALHQGSASATYTIDGTPPSAPGNLTAKAIKKGINLTWTASSDNVGVASYTVFRNGVAVGTTSGTLYTDRPSSGTYSYKVVAKDAAGNVSPDSNTVTATRR